MAVLLKDLKYRMIKELSSMYSAQEAGRIAAMVLENIAGVSPMRLVTEPDLEADAGVLPKFEQALGDLLAGMPVQYVLGQADFCGLKLMVNADVLIPRQETEELVHWISKEHRLQPGLKVLDIGTGSGCIMLSLGQSLLQPILTAVDVSNKALAVAAMNAAGQSMAVNLARLDILDPDQWHRAGKFDLLVSNPPYVTESEKRLMQRNVLDYEPPVALYVPDAQPLLYYEAIAAFAREHLEMKGWVYFEINEAFGGEIANVLKEKGFNRIELKKDLNGKDRMIRACF